jgi:hypothetical protein
MEVRNIFFNVGYLSRMSKKANDLTSVVTSIWDDFANSYGDVFKFKIEYDDVNKRMLLREEGYSHHKVNDIIKNRTDILDGNQGVGAGIFEFPVMEAGSIVKTNTINAKLPDRMQIAAMYGVRQQAGEKEESTKDYDELVGNAWGVLSEDLKDDPEPTEEEKKLKRRKDMMTGAIDYPSRRNRSFGRKDANLNKPLWVGPITETDENNWERQGVGEGTQIRPSIINNVNETQKEYMSHMAKVFQDGKDKSISKEKLESIYFAATDFRLNAAADREAFLKEGLGWYEAGNLSTITWGTNAKTNEEGTYNEASNNYKKLNKGEQLKNLNAEKTYMEGLNIKGENNSGHIQLKPLFGAELTKLLRGDQHGVLAKISPLIPVDFEMEIDGTGGMFPGNSFHSSYLGTRYREESVFQMVGVDHSIDSSGWTTTIKGQIRSKPTAMPQSAKELAAALEKNEELKKAAADAKVAADEAAAAAKTAEEKVAYEDRLKKYYAANQEQVNADVAAAAGIAKVLHTELIADSWTSTEEVDRVLNQMTTLSKQGQEAVIAEFAKLDKHNVGLVRAITSEVWKGDWQETYVGFATLRNNPLDLGPPTGE